MKNIQDLRDALFQTLQGVKDGNIEIDRARAINETAQVIINTAKVEVDYMRQTGAQVGTGFVPALDDSTDPDGKRTTATGTATRIGNSTVHRMR